MLGPQFESVQFAGKHTVRRKGLFQFAGIEAFPFPGKKRFHHHIDGRGCIIHDIHAMAVGAVNGCQFEVRIAGLQVARGMIVQHHLAQFKHGEQCGHRACMPARKHAHGGQQAVSIQGTSAKHLIAPGLLNMAMQLVRGLPRHSIQNRFTLSHCNLVSETPGARRTLDTILPCFALSPWMVLLVGM
ncbi:MAG: hypothetical protein BWY09_01912 [Candidatus Hydrogenedentes bacterium ADurb.Bin179]|nr:MAG: hypothetical protein BWY09_01912 [Candidatus Hydrogenedentes bacterium ADurb.Bin179]